MQSPRGGLLNDEIILTLYCILTTRILMLEGRWLSSARR